VKRLSIYIAVVALAVGAVLLSLLELKTAANSDAKVTRPEVATDRESVGLTPDLERFSQKLVDILSDAQMQSQLTERVDELCKELDPSDLEGLLDLAATLPPEGISESSWLLGFNQLMEYVAVRKEFEAADLLYRLASNLEASPVMRDYASQHYMLGEAMNLEQLLTKGEEGETRRHLRSVLVNVGELVKLPAKDIDSLAGTTLLGLASLSSRFESESGEFEMIKEAIEPLVVPVLKNCREYGSPLTSSAIQVAGRLGIKEAGPIIARIAVSKEARKNDRLSAIAALRYFPELVEIASIKARTKGDKRLSYAVESLNDELNID
jgi:hypothetical protein